MSRLGTVLSSFLLTNRIRPPNRICIPQRYMYVLYEVSELQKANADGRIPDNLRSKLERVHRHAAGADRRGVF
jgi:hypothetical protein